MTTPRVTGRPVTAERATAGPETANPAGDRNYRRDGVHGRLVHEPVRRIVAGRYPAGAALPTEAALVDDIRLASTTSSFAAAEIKLGWISGGGVSALRSASLSASDAALMLLTGDPVTAAEAHRIGLVSRLYEPDRLLDAARELAATIAARPPIAAQAAKANLLAAREAHAARFTGH